MNIPCFLDAIEFDVLHADTREVQHWSQIDQERLYEIEKMVRYLRFSSLWSIIKTSLD